MSRPDLEQQQLRKFRQLVAHAGQRSRFYREVIRTRNINIEACRPQDFPVLTKNELLENFDDIVTVANVTKAKLERFLSESKDPVELFQDHYVVFNSSGTSGRTAMFIYSIEEYFASMSRVLAASAQAAGSGRKLKVAFVGAIRGHFAGITMASSLRLFPDHDAYDLRPIDILRPWADVVEELNRFDPDALYSYSSALLELAERKLRGELTATPAFLRCGGEALLPADRHSIEAAFQAPLMNVYASSECLYMGATHGGTAMTLFEDDLIFELHDNHTCVTNLFNHTLPLIRYRFDDMLVPTPNADGGPYQSVNELLGRHETNLILENDAGEADAVSAVALALLHLPDVRQFQFVGRGKKAFTMKIRINEGRTIDAESVASNVRRELCQLLAKKRMSSVAFDVEPVATLGPDSRSGKFRLVVPDAGAH